MKREFSLEVGKEQKQEGKKSVMFPGLSIPIVFLSLLLADPRTVWKV